MTDEPVAGEEGTRPPNEPSGSAPTMPVGSNDKVVDSANAKRVDGNLDGVGSGGTPTRADEAGAKAADRRPGNPTTGDTTAPVTASISRLSVLKGLLLYGAVLTFAGLYIFFIVKISQATGKPPSFDTALTSAAAALAGVLGSAFALYIGTPLKETDTNGALRQREQDQADPEKSNQVLLFLHRALSLEPGTTAEPSWPRAFGIWAYAAVGAAVAITYVLNEHQTPDMIKALAVAFGGYLLALLHNAYTKSGS